MSLPEAIFNGKHLKLSSREFTSPIYDFMLNNGLREYQYAEGEISMKFRTIDVPNYHVSGYITTHSHVSILNIYNFRDGDQYVMSRSDQIIEKLNIALNQDDSLILKKWILTIYGLRIFKIKETGMTLSMLLRKNTKSAQSAI